MKRLVSLTLSAALLCGMCMTSALSSAAAAVRPTVTLVESKFENGLEAPFIANVSDEGLSATVTPVSIADASNAYLQLTNRKADSRSATIQQNIKAQLKENGADGKYYISARIKLATEGDTAYAVPYIHGNKVQMQPGAGERFAVSDAWGEIGKKNDGSYMAFASVGLDLTADNLAALTWCKMYVMLFAESTGSAVYNGDYAMDDVTLWFVPNAGAPEKVTTVGTNELKDGTFDAKVAEPNYYNTQKGAGDAWYVATTDGESTSPAMVTATVATESVAAADTSVVHAGTGALHVTARPGAHQSIAVNLKDIINEVGALADGEGYYMSVWVRAEKGQTLKMQPIFGAGSGKGSAFILGGEFVTVTDEWTEVGIKLDGTYSMFAKDNGDFYDPYGAAWANIRLRTEGTENFYVDDFKVMGPQKPSDAASAFVQSVATLPAPDAISYSHEVLIANLEEAYKALNLDVLTDEQKTTVAEAKAKLEAARAAFDALPPKKNSFTPTFTYENNANLIAPYGDLETFTANDYVWNQENVEGEHPQYTLVTDPAIAHKGNNCLLISDREKSQHAAAFTLTDVVKDNGAGKYYFSCWMRTKNPGEVMEVFPLLYVGGLAKEFYIDNDARYTITNEWTFVGVTYDNLDGFYRSNGEEMPVLDERATYVALRFYGQDETLESAEDGNPYPDYYIDDLKFWKAFDGQADYQDPDNKPGETPDDGKPDSPATGSVLPLAIPVLGVAAAGSLLITKKRRK